MTLDGFDFSLHASSVRRRGGAFVFQRNEYDGLAAIGATNGSGFDVNDPIQASHGGHVTFEYNYFHNFDSKISQVSATD